MTTARPSTSLRPGHVPVLLDDSGLKLSKQNHALPIDSANAAQNLIRALTLLGQREFAADWHGRVDDILSDAIQRWDPTRIPRQLEQATGVANTAHSTAIRPETTSSP